ncbi:UNC93-like protein, partial [Stegodyphus mimosarum]
MKKPNNMQAKMEVDYGDKKKKNSTAHPLGAPVMSKLRIMKNLVIVCLGFLFLFSAYQGLANLQSTMNMKGDLGTVSQSVIYAALIFSSLFLPKLVIKKLGCKLTLALSILTYAPYIAANFYPHMGTFVPTAIVLGLGAAPLWSAKCTYLNEISVLYAGHGTDSADIITSRFFGIFFMVFQNTQIWGNLASYFVLKPMKPNATNSFESPDNDLNSNRTNLTCGVDFCSGLNENLQPPTEDKRYMLIAIYLSCAILAAIIVSIFLDPLPTEKKSKVENENVLSRVVATLKHLKKVDQLLLVPITVFSGIEQAFILGDYTKAYVACAWGLHRVGLVFICFGVVNAIMSFLAGRLVKYVSRVAFMLAGALGNVAVCTALFLWQPEESQSIYFFVLIGVWGLSDAIWQTQINALYGVLFRSEEEAAFSNYRLWESLGFSIAFAYSTFLCIAPKMYILLGFLATGITGYLIVEIKTWNRKNSYDLPST